MQIEKIEFEQIRYNPERGAFEALIRLREHGQTYSYPVEAMASMYADFDLISQRLTVAATQAHGAKTPGLRAVRTEAADVDGVASQLDIWTPLPHPPLAA